MSELFSEDMRVIHYDPLIPPVLLCHEIPWTNKSRKTVLEGREEVVSIVTGSDAKQRLLLIIGPSLIRDPETALEYCDHLIALKEKYKDDLLIIMRSYRENQRTTVGWRGLVNDPDIDGSFNINNGLRVTRQLFVDLTDKGMPVSAEMLDMISPQFFADVISVGAVDARTTESELHRELASGLGFAVDFRNGTDGTLSIAIDAIRAAEQPHRFLSVDRQGLAAIVSTSGNKDCFVILKGYYDEESIAEVNAALKRSGLRRRLVVDCNDADQILNGKSGIIGVMIESNTEEGSQEVPAIGPAGLEYGISTRDARTDWEDTEAVLEKLAIAVRQRRKAFRQSTHAEEMQAKYQAAEIDRDSIEGGPPQSRGGPRSHNLVWSDKETDARTIDSDFI